MKISPLLKTIGRFGRIGLLLACALPVQAQLYKIIGPDGKVTYSDVPPQTKNAKVERKNLGGTGSSDANLPYEVAEAAKNHPGTVYTSASCAPCDEARNWLKQRGVPFSEKTVASNDDQTKLKQVAGELSLPFILIGRTKLRGFEPGSVQAALASAGYPESNKLPSNYVFRAPESAAPVVEPKPAPVKPRPTAPIADEAKEVRPTPAPENNAPPGFRF